MSSSEVYPLNPALPPAHTDELTRLPNRAWLNLQLAEQVSSQPGNFAVVFIDLDGLKSMNDKHGHAAGDQLLLNAAASICNSLRTEEADKPRLTDELITVARQGGDEFVAILKGVSYEAQVNLIMERVRENLKIDGIAASMGGRPHQAGESASDLLKAADQLMYQDKEARKRAYRESLPRHRRLAAWAGEKLLGYAGLPAPR